jgi:hypothetical protein
VGLTGYVGFGSYDDFVSAGADVDVRAPSEYISFGSCYAFGYFEADVNVRTPIGRGYVVYLGFCT